MIKLPEIFVQELRASCNCPKRWQPLDFLGAAFGLTMFFAGLHAMRRGSFSRPAGLALMGLGAYSTVLHSVRFFTSPPLTKIYP